MLTCPSVQSATTMQGLAPLGLPQSVKKDKIPMEYGHRKVFGLKGPKSHAWPELGTHLLAHRLPQRCQSCFHVATSQSAESSRLPLCALSPATSKPYGCFLLAAGLSLPVSLPHPPFLKPRLGVASAKPGSVRAGPFGRMCPGDLLGGAPPERFAQIGVQNKTPPQELDIFHGLNSNRHCRQICLWPVISDQSFQSMSRYRRTTRPEAVWESFSPAAMTF